MRTNKKAIRIIAFLLVIALCLTGCTPEIQEAVQEAWVEQFETVQKPQLIALWEQIKGKISAQLPKTGNFAQEEATESTPPTADTSVQEETKESSSWQDRFQDSKAEATVIPDEVEIRYHATGATNVPEAHVISFNKLFSSKRISDQCPVKPGYVFLGWGTTKDATEVAYQPGDKYDKRESVLLYAVWEACTHQNADGELYGLNFEIEKKTRCTRCNGEVPPGLYYFSDYVKAMKPWYVFWKWDYTNLSSEELNEALADYLARKEEGYKTVLDYLEKHGMPTVPVPQETENILSEFIKEYNTAEDQIKKYYNTVFSDKKMRDAIIPVSADRSDLEAFEKEVKPGIDTLKKVLSGAEAIQAMVSFGESCKKYDEEMLDGIINTYHIQMQKIACGIEFAEALNSLAGFLYSVAGTKTVSVLMPDPADFHQMIETLKFNEVSCEIFDSLAFLNIPKNEETACIQAFSNLSVIEEDARGNKVIVYKAQEEDIQVQKTRWPNGPTAKQAFEYIQQLEKQRLIVPGWYFYLGWRMEHETMNIILMVLDDKI